VTRDAVLLCAGALACAALALGLAGRGLECPGLNYDEVIQAEPALWFLRAEASPPEVPGARSVTLFGRPFPWLTQPYMGALKSQLLLPVFAFADADAHSLRLATLALALAGLACAMAFARRAFDLPTALLLGLLLAVDPSFLFTSRHDWGSFAAGFLLRSLALLLLLDGWQRRSAARLCAGGVCAGLSIYNKIDSAVPVLALGAALAAAWPGCLRLLRERRCEAGVALAGLALGSSPVWLRALRVFEAARHAAFAHDPGEPAEKLSALVHTLDGSYFERLMRAGGSFERLAEQSAATATPFLALFALASLALAWWVARDRREGRDARALRFALLAALFCLAAMLAVPRAIRIHHVLNAWPFPQLVVALAAREAWRRAGAQRIWARAGVALALGAALVGALRADVATLDSMRSSCGHGRWSDALARLAPELAREHARAVCLDWGFAGPLRFAQPGLRIDEAVWRLRAKQPPALTGDANDVYLFFQRDYQVYPYGLALAQALTALPPGAATLTRHADRAGETAFVSLRFAGPHRLVYRDGRFQVELR
jgi:hypothetical protein